MRCVGEAAATQQRKRKCRCVDARQRRMRSSCVSCCGRPALVAFSCVCRFVMSASEKGWRQQASRILLNSQSYAICTHNTSHVNGKQQTAVLTPLITSRRTPLMTGTSHKSVRAVTKISHHTKAYRSPSSRRVAAADEDTAKPWSRYICATCSAFVHPSGSLSSRTRMKRGKRSAMPLLTSTKPNAAR